MTKTMASDGKKRRRTMANAFYPCPSCHAVRKHAGLLNNSLRSHFNY